MASLHFMTSTGRREVELKDVCSIGRLPSSDVSLDGDPKVGRSHARIRRDGSTYLLEDLQSRNGTFLERGYAVTRVTEPTPLIDGDIIRVSSERLRFVATSDEPLVEERPRQMPHLSRELGISVSPVRRDIEPTEVRREKTVLREGPPPPPPAAVAGRQGPASPEEDEEVVQLRRQVEAMSRQLAELQAKLADRK